MWNRILSGIQTIRNRITNQSYQQNTFFIRCFADIYTYKFKEQNSNFIQYEKNRIIYFNQNDGFIQKMY